MDSEHLLIYSWMSSTNMFDVSVIWTPPHRTPPLGASIFAHLALICGPSNWNPDYPQNIA